MLTPLRRRGHATSALAAASLAHVQIDTSHSDSVRPTIMFMNIFRITGDVCHLLSFVVMFWKLHTSRSVAGAGRSPNPHARPNPSRGPRPGPIPGARPGARPSPKPEPRACR